MAFTDPQVGRKVRSMSISSDRTSLTGYGGLISPPSNTSPEPAYIAASAASQIVTNDHDSQAETWFDQHGIEPSGETALVAAPALKLVNRFLDQLLFNFLSVSRSTALTSLRAGVREVLGAKLSNDAINGADQELHEYLGGGDDEELFAAHNGLEASRDWDLELVWKRTRLRCMVYSSLGDMEEEDEDMYTELDHLDGSPGSRNRFSNGQGVVSPAVAIFLTSILEYMGEQVLIVAGQAAYYRLRAKHLKDERDGTIVHTEIAERVVVNAPDIEKAGADKTLTKLWRKWKKREGRSPNLSISMNRSFSRDSISRPQTGQASSTSGDLESEAGERSLAAILAEHDFAAGIPLPMYPNDIREIEIPGLANQSDDDEVAVSSEDEGIQIKSRPKSMLLLGGTQSPTKSKHPEMTPLAIAKTRKRSDSSPTPIKSPYKSPASKKFGGDANPAELGETNDLAKSEEEQKHSKPMLANIITGATAIGAAAVGGIIAAAHGQAPQTTADSMEDNDADVDFTEEPQIMTSSRISIGGRISPDDPKGLSRRSSVRSPSVHSLRLIEVSSPKSAGPSRNSSMDAADFLNGRSGGLASPGIQSASEGHTPRIASPVLRGTTASPLIRNGSSLSARHTRNSAGDSISEVDEKDGDDSDSSQDAAIHQNHRAAIHRDEAEANRHSPPLSSPKSNRHFQVNQPFVLSAPPKTRDTPVQLSNNHAGHSNGNLSVGSRAVNNEQGALPLTPLREMMETAPDTSDEAGSFTHSHDDHSSSDHGHHAADYHHSPSVSGSTIHPTKRTMDSPTTPRAPANYSRASPSRPSRDNARKGVPEPLAKVHRPTHTSGSSTSSKVKPIRTSEENTVEPKGQSFEQLIRSDQTIQYTLTPESMRNIEFPDSPRSVVPPTLVQSEGQRARSHSSSVSKFAALHSNPPDEKPKSVKSVKTQQSYPASHNGARLRPNAPQARDARIDRDSIGDFADFIRSTGPVSSYEPTPPRTAPAAQSHRGTNGSARNASGSIPHVAPIAALPRRAESSAGRNRLLAREAAVNQGDSISDLIDFVRTGPQIDKESHRIPRTVAPFRSTMDSDQMSGAVGGKAIDANLQEAGRYSQATSTPHSSVTSQSALLAATKSKQYPVPQSNQFDQEDMMPKRKTRRVRDPYAIDFSDEEEELEGISRPKPIQEEESLADFLKNVPPPPDSPKIVPFNTTALPKSMQPPTLTKNVKKKSSTPSIISRFTRHSSTSVPQVPPKSSARATYAQSGSRATPSDSQSAPRHKAITVPSAPTEPTQNHYHAPQPIQNENYHSQEPPRRRVAQKSYEPREAVVSSQRGTSNLADFLRDSGPSNSTQMEPQLFTPIHNNHIEEASAFKRMFGRKKAAPQAH